MGGPEKVERETCDHCQYKGLPGGYDGCLAGIAYDCADERNAKIYYGEVRHLRKSLKMPATFGMPSGEGDKKKPPAV